MHRPYERKTKHTGHCLIYMSVLQVQQGHFCNLVLTYSTSNNTGLFTNPPSVLYSGTSVRKLSWPWHINHSVNTWFISKTFPLTLNCICLKPKSSDRNSSMCCCCSPNTTLIQSKTSERWAAAADHHHLTWWAACRVCRTVAFYNNTFNLRPNLFITGPAAK